MVERSLLWIGGGCKYEQLYRTVFSDSFKNIHGGWWGITGLGCSIMLNISVHFLRMYISDHSWPACNELSCGPVGPYSSGWWGRIDGPLWVTCLRWIPQILMMWRPRSVIHDSKATSVVVMGEKKSLFGGADWAKPQGLTFHFWICTILSLIFLLIHADMFWGEKYILF